MPTGGCVFAISLVPCCWCFDRNAQWVRYIYSSLRRRLLSFCCRKIPKHDVKTHAVGPSYRTDMVRGRAVGISQQNWACSICKEKETPWFLWTKLFFRVTLSRSMLVKYLGVVLDSRLTWRENVKVRKAHNLLWACIATWCLRPGVVHWLYVCIIRPSFTLASLVWCLDCQTANAKKRCMLRDNRSGAHYSDWCYGGNGSLHWIWWFRVRGISGALIMESGILVLPSPQSRT